MHQLWCYDRGLGIIMDKGGIEISMIVKLILGLVVILIIIGILLLISTGGTEALETIINIFRFA